MPRVSLTSQIEMAKIAFLEKLIAKAVPSVASFLSKTLPNAMVKATPALTKGMDAIGGYKNVKYITGGIGAGIGGIKGYNSAPEDQKGKGALMGAAIGGAIGGFGGSQLGNKLNPATFGKMTTNSWKPAGEALSNWAKNTPVEKQTFGNLLSKTKNYAAREFAPKWTPVTPGSNISERPMAGFKKQEVTHKLDSPERGFFANSIGRLSRSYDALAEGPKAAVQHLTQEMKDARYFNVKKDGEVYRAKRSLIGQVANPLFDTGLGFGAFEAATTSNENGSPTTVGQRLRRGGTTALGWGFARPVMMGKMLIDTPKMFSGGGTPPPQY
jgi:hypothetical protein